MPELPSGTVTFLFTDIEGSTRLLQQLRGRYAELLETHHRLLRAAFEKWGGEEIDSQGDAFFVVFRRAKDAISAAVAAQRALTAHPWPDGLAVRVRMGLHTGEPSLSEAGLVSLAVHRAARISSAGHGGQVLLSSTTCDLVEDELPDDVRVRNLGEHRLKDLDRPERLFQLEIEGLPADFPPLKTLESQPEQATPFERREEELARAAQAAVAARRISRRRALLLAALVGVLAAAVSIPVFALGRGDSGGGSRLEVSGNAVGVIDPETNSVVGDIPVGARPGPLDFGAGALWVANLDDETVSRVDPATRKVVRAIAIGGRPSDLDAGSGAVWTLSTSPTVRVRQIDPRFDTVAKTIEVESLPGGSGGVALGRSALWVAPSLGLVTRIDPASSKVVEALDARSSPTSIATDGEAVWIADASANTVTRIDETNVVTPIPVGRGPSGIAVAEDAVWVTESLDDAVVRIDPDRAAATTTISVGRAPSGIAVGEGAVWVANSRDGTVSRIDPDTNEVIDTIEVGGSPRDVVVGAGKVWVSVQATVLEEGVSVTGGGGILHVNAQQDVDFLDPALGELLLAWQLGYATCAKLLNYPGKPPPAGAQLVPEVAASLPERSADGKSYTFTIREGFRFSPPSNEPVTAETFKYAIERSLHPRMKGPARSFMGDIAGAEAFMAGKAQHISGLTVTGNELTIRLVDVRPDFLARITLPFFCPVPVGTPIDPGGVRGLPSAGPYYVAAYSPGEGIVLKRNPNYGGGRLHHLQEILVTVGVDKAESVRQIEAGSADYAIDGVPPEAVPRLSANYGPRSPAARSGRQQYFFNPILHVDFLVLNPTRPPFSDVRIRQAANYAIDRQALAREGNIIFPLPAKPTDQHLPPGMLGFRDANIYPFRPDLARAKELAAGRGGKAILWTCNVAPCRQIAEIVKANLKQIGIEVEIEEFPVEVLFANVDDPPLDILTIPRFAEYQDPSNILNLLIRNLLEPSYRRKVDAAARLAGPRRYLRYAELDAELARRAAPVVAYANATAHDFFSARIGCQVNQPVYGIDIAALCVRR
jgi:YVTN family beta-propeller protein